jgi:nucleotide-binding universal stress UspA family protein
VTKARAAVPSTGPEFRRILVPTDLTERTRKALHLALMLAKPGLTRVTLLHVIETIPGLGSRDLKPLYRQLERQARTKMAALVRREPERDIEVTQEIGSGARAETIVGFAAAYKADLIVLASHKVNLSAVGRDWGTISYKVGILAQCPVLLVK